MARARNLKPALFKNELLGVADPHLTILFASLWCLADREGRLEDRPLRIGAETFPYRGNLDVNGYITELERMGFVCRYVVEGVRILQVENFSKHQNPHKTEKLSCLPENPRKSARHDLDVHGRLVNGSRPADSLELIPDNVVLNPSIEAGGESPDIAFAEFENVWLVYPKRPGASKPDSFRAWKARIRAGANPDEILAGTRRYAAFVIACRTDPQFIKQPATFFGPGEHYKSDWVSDVHDKRGTAQLGKAGQATARAAEQWLSEQEHG